MLKFEALAAYFEDRSERTFELPFYKIEAITGGKLPKSASEPQYWANTSKASNPVQAALKGTFYDAFLIKGAKRVEFRRK